MVQQPPVFIRPNVLPMQQQKPQPQQATLIQTTGGTSNQMAKWVIQGGNKPIQLHPATVTSNPPVNHASPSSNITSQPQPQQQHKGLQFLNVNSSQQQQQNQQQKVQLAIAPSSVTGSQQQTLTGGGGQQYILQQQPQTQGMATINIQQPPQSAQLTSVQAALPEQMHVQIRPQQPTQLAQQSSAPARILVAQDGQIRQIQLGQPIGQQFPTSLAQQQQQVQAVAPQATSGSVQVQDSTSSQQHVLGGLQGINIGNTVQNVNILASHAQVINMLNTQQQQDTNKNQQQNSTLTNVTLNLGGQPLNLQQLQGLPYSQPAVKQPQQISNQINTSNLPPNTTLRLTDAMGKSITLTVEQFQRIQQAQQMQQQQQQLSQQQSLQQQNTIKTEPSKSMTITSEQFQQLQQSPQVIKTESAPQMQHITPSTLVLQQQGQQSSHPKSSVQLVMTGTGDNLSSQNTVNNSNVITSTSAMSLHSNSTIVTTCSPASLNSQSVRDSSPPVGGVAVNVPKLLRHQQTLFKQQQQQQQHHQQQQQTNNTIPDLRASPVPQNSVSQNLQNSFTQNTLAPNVDVQQLGLSGNIPQVVNVAQKSTANTTPVNTVNSKPNSLGALLSAPSTTPNPVVHIPSSSLVTSTPTTNPSLFPAQTPNNNSLDQQQVQQQKIWHFLSPTNQQFLLKLNENIKNLQGIPNR